MSLSAPSKLKWPLLILAGAFILWTRLGALTLRPVHHDEGVNANFMKILINSGSYKYDPTNYHGPSLYFLQLPVSWLGTLFALGPGGFSFSSDAGLTVVSIRSLMVLSGLLILAGIWAVRPVIGPTGAAAAFILAVVSCNLIYYSRYFIHEIYVVLFTFGMYLSGLHYLLKPRRWPVIAFAASAAMLFCTKETSVITFGVFALAALFTELLARRAAPAAPSPAAEARKNLLADRRTLVIAALVAIAIWLVLFSSFFTNARGPVDSIRTYFFWTKEGLHSGHAKDFSYYVQLLLAKYELPILLFGLYGAATAFVRMERRGLFLAFWSAGIIGTYSLIPYKTPWIVINMILPLLLSAGYGLQRLWDDALAAASPRIARAGLASIFGLLVGYQAIVSAVVNYDEYDLEKHDLVYTHTIREVNELMRRIASIAKKTGLGHDMPISVVAPEYWPLPFYLKDYRNAAYWGGLSALGAIEAPVVIARLDQESALKPLLKEPYISENYTLRQGVNIALYIREASLSGGTADLPEVPDFLNVQSEPAGATVGLLRRSYAGTEPTGKPVRIDRGMRDYAFRWDLDSDKPLPAPFSMEFEGLLRVPQDGVYNLALESDDGSWLYLDDVLLVDNGGKHAQRKIGHKANLKAGLHKILIRYFDAGGGAIMKFYWTPPGRDEEPVPGEAFLHT